MAPPDPQRSRLIDVELDATIGRSTPDVEHERAVAIFDLIEENSFAPVNDGVGGPLNSPLEEPAVVQQHDLSNCRAHPHQDKRSGGGSGPRRHARTLQGSDR